MTTLAQVFAQAAKLTEMAGPVYERVTFTGETGSITVDTLVDTGAAGCQITPEIVAAVNPVPFADQRVIGVGGIFTMPMVVLRDIEIRGRKLSNVYQMPQAFLAIIGKTPIVGHWVLEELRLDIRPRSQDVALAQAPSYNKDEGPPDMSVIGPKYWAQLHSWSERLAAEVGDSCGCGIFAQNATRALHDVVNIHLGKKALYPETLREMAKVYQEAVRQAEMAQAAPLLVNAEQRLPLCTPAQQERLERCIQEVKAQGGKANPWAVCQASLECRRRLVTQSGIEPWPEGMFDDEEEEDEGMEQAKTSPSYICLGKRVWEQLHDMVADGKPKQQILEFMWNKGAPYYGKFPDFSAHFSQSFLDTILHTAIGTGVAIGVSKVLNPPAPSIIKEEEKPKEPVPAVLSPAHVEGDQENVDLGTLLEELDAILKKPETMGIVDAETLTIVRE